MFLALAKTKSRKIALTELLIVKVMEKEYGYIKFSEANFPFQENLNYVLHLTQFNLVKHWWGFHLFTDSVQNQLFQRFKNDRFC